MTPHTWENRICHKCDLDMLHITLRRDALHYDCPLCGEWDEPLIEMTALATAAAIKAEWLTLTTKGERK